MSKFLSVQLRDSDLSRMIPIDDISGIREEKAGCTISRYTNTDLSVRDSYQHLLNVLRDINLVVK